MKLFSASELDSWLAQSVKSAFSLEISRYSNSSSGKLPIWFLSSSGLMTFHMVSSWSNVWFCPSVWRLIGWTWEKVQKLLFCKFSNSYFPKAISLTSSDNVFVDVFLPIMCFFQKSLSCMFHEVFMLSTDRNYRISQCECACCCLSHALTGRTFWKLSQLFLHVVTEKRSCFSNRFLPSFWKPASKSIKGCCYQCIHRFSGGFWTKLFSPSSQHFLS